MTSPLPPTGAEREIRERIAHSGPLTFAEFMAVALYWPQGGYYAARDTFGPQGDFYTAPLTHPVFGALVARQLAEMWRAQGAPHRWWVVEPGAGDGRLASDASDWAGSDVSFGGALRYVTVDHTAPKLRSAETARIASRGLPFRKLRGAIVANELLDALPAHRVTVERGALREIRVGVDSSGSFKEVLADPVDGVGERLESLGVRLPEGYRAEVCLEAARWIAAAAEAIDEGFVLLVDYGHESEAYYDASRNRGTLRCYYKHTLGMDPYSHVGRQDISVHVELTSLRQAARAAGLSGVGSASQAEFLRGLGFDAYRADIASRLDIPASIRTANLRALDTLIDADGMGGFRVLAFSKGVPEAKLSGFSGEAPPLRVTAPLATPAHMPLGGAGDGGAMPTWEELLR
jgi:SAM-dependent MidA family methyltransferase